MLGRPFAFASLLAASVGIPYLSSTARQSLSLPEGGLAGFFSSSEEKTASKAVPEAGPFETSNPAWLNPSGPPPAQQTPLEGFRAHDLAAVLRFDVTPQWIYDHWSRKSTSLAELDLFGVRVPLVTGTRPDDLAGSLTYYFNHQGSVERIDFSGRTGDPRKLVTLLVNQYQFRPQRPDIAGEQYYEVQWNGRPTSQLFLRPAPVIWASAPHATYQVELVMNRPGSSRFVPPRHPQISIPAVPDPEETAPPAAQPAE